MPLDPRCCGQSVPDRPAQHSAGLLLALPTLRMFLVGKEAEEDKPAPEAG